ncbi:thioesterase domain-containing protein [Pseudomonas syringae]
MLAYVVSNGQPSVDMSMRLRDQLRKTLPTYMVPAAVIVLKQFPLTSNGKIDRSALPLPEFDSSDSLPPDTDFGKAIAEAWKDVLELKTVPGRSANFFALGGHSLQAVRMLSLIKHRLGFEIALRNLFITNTLQEFIDAVVLNTAAAKFSAVHFGGAREKQVIFCIHPVGGHITGYRTLALSMMKYFSVYGLQAGEILTHEEDLNSLNDLAAAHCKAIVAVQSHGPYRLLGWSSGGALAVAIASMMEAQGYIVDYVGLIDPRSVERSYQNNQASLALSLKTTLAALRTSVFEINIEKQMRLHQINLEQLFLSSNLENAKMLFSQFLGVNISKDMASSILDQVLLTQKYIKLLSFISPSPVNALVHVIWAKETLDNIERNKCGVHVNPPDLVIEEQIATDHYRIMQHPFTERVADAICRVIIAKAK